MFENCGRMMEKATLHCFSKLQSTVVYLLYNLLCLIAMQSSLKKRMSSRRFYLIVLYLCWRC